MMNIEGYIACICEGNAESAIIDLLLDNNLLSFSRENMLENEVIRCRSGKQFEERYLRKQFDREITIIRILDSRKEKFKLSKAYEKKVKVINVVTAPEIEMLIIHSEKKYQEYQKSRKKTSEFCKENLKMHNVKSYDFVYKYFSNIEILIGAIKNYHEKANIDKNEYSLNDLLKKI